MHENAGKMEDDGVHCDLMNNVQKFAWHEFFLDTLNKFGAKDWPDEPPIEASPAQIVDNIRNYETFCPKQLAKNVIKGEMCHNGKYEEYSMDFKL
jgi:hypothetical protein